MITEIFVEGKKLDITADISSLLTFALDDVKDFSARSTTYSKTVVLPGTANNNAIFGNIFETGLSNSYDPAADNIGINFNPSKSARCYVYQDNLQTFKGTIRLLEIDIDHERIEYQAALNGELTMLSVALSSGLLTDLDFSAYDRSYTVADIAASWDNPGGSGVYYPLIDYGTYSVNKHDWDIRTFRPALYVKEFIDKIFSTAGYTYSSNLFNSDRFKKLIIPFNKKIFQSETNEEFSASRTSSANWLDQASASFTRPLQFNTVIGTLFVASNSNSRFTYTGADPLTAHFTFGCGNRMLKKTKNFHIGVFLNGTLVPGSQTDYFADGNPAAGFYSFNYAFDYTISNGEYLELITWCDGMAGGDPDYMQCNFAAMGCTSTASVLAPVDIGDFYHMNQAIPENIRQIDFLLSIVKLFNLYITESQFDEKKMFIEPFVDFYSASSGSAIDWTYKMNRNEVRKIIPMSEVNSKIYNFRYASDTDYFNDLYKKRYNQGYGSYIFDTEFEFASESNTLELIFASTPLVGYDGQDKVYPTIFKSNNGVEERIDSVIRILQTKKVTGVTTWSLKNGASTIGAYSKYGYAGHLDDPDNPDNDLNFGALKELFFTLGTGDLTKTQFNLYWSSYMAEITDKDSKMLIAKFYLKPQDIFKLNFATYITVDGVLYRLNKITDYNMSVPTDCEVQLLRVINTAYAFDPPPPLGSFSLLSDVGEKLIDSDSSYLRTE